MDIEQILIIVASLLIGACIIAYIMKNWLWQRYNILRHPEKVIRIIILYPGNMKKTFYRLIPSDKQIKIDERIYIYDKDSTIQREGHKKIIPKPELHDKAFVYCDDKGDYVVCEGRRYDMNESLAIREPTSKIMELYYFYDSPLALRMDYDKRKVDLSSADMKDFKENDLFTKLLTMRDTQNMMLILIIIGAANALISLVLLAKNMGWIK